MAEPAKTDGNVGKTFVLGSANSDPSGRGGSFFDSQTAFAGKLKTAAPLRIDGPFEGEIEASAPIEIGPNASVRARILGASVTIFGKFEGTIHAQERIVLAKKAVVRADLTTPSIAIEDGVTFVGRCSMPQAGQPAEEAAN